MGIYTAEDKQNDITQWLSYWVVYAIFVNVEEADSSNFIFEFDQSQSANEIKELIGKYE